MAQQHLDRYPRHTSLRQTRQGSPLSHRRNTRLVGRFHRRSPADCSRDNWRLRGGALELLPLWELGE